MEKLNTHHYDGKLRSVYKSSRNKTADYKNVFDALKEVLKRNFKNSPRLTSAIRGVTLISNNVGDESSYDSTNNVRAEDILFDICLSCTDDTLPYLFEQLADIIDSGQCPQGRTIRLLQIYLTFS